jgi:hypothetical protein
MFLIVALVIVGGVTVVVARTIQLGIGNRQLIGNNHGSSSPSQLIDSVARTVSLEVDTEG